MNIKINFKNFLIMLSVMIITTLSVYAFSFRNMTLDFVHISDTHITNRPDTSYKALSSSSLLLRDAVDQINKIQSLDFVLFTGDMTDSANDENFELFYNSISRLKYPHLNAFGNHDFYGNMNKDEVIKTVKHYNKNYIFNDTYYAITPKTDYRIIVLDSSIKNENTSNGKLSAEQLKFLDNELLENQDKIVVIAMHHPSVEPFVSIDHSLLNAKEFNEILLKYKNPIIVLSGHYHAAKIRKIGNIVFVSTPSLVTYPMACRHIKIVNFKDRVKYNFEFINTTLEDIKEQNRQNVISYSALAGLERDRNVEFTFFKSRYKSANFKRKRIEKAVRTTKTSKRELKKLNQPEVSKKEIKQSRQGLFKKKNKQLQEM